MHCTHTTAPFDTSSFKSVPSESRMCRWQVVASHLDEELCYTSEESLLYFCFGTDRIRHDNLKHGLPTWSSPTLSLQSPQQHHSVSRHRRSPLRMHGKEAAVPQTSPFRHSRLDSFRPTVKAWAGLIFLTWTETSRRYFISSISEGRSVGS